MKTLIDAVAQVTSRPLVPVNYPQVVPLVQVQESPAASGFAQCASGLLMPANQGGPLRKRNHDSVASSEVAASTKRAAKCAAPEDVDKREKRLGQNRIAAVESRRRKKHMVEELQRSVQYYSRSNATLKSQNAELERQLLLAKHHILMKERQGDDMASAADSSLRNVKAPIPASKAPPHQVPSSEQVPIISHQGSLCVPSSIPTYTSKADMDDQAQHAQFVATQALYTSMGYPAGAARFAASTLSQFVGQGGTAPVTSAPIDCVAPPHRFTAPIVAQQIKSAQPMISSDNTLKSTDVEAKEDSYIDALNRFAMQQAAAANAAAAAATAAIQAAQLHIQFKEGGGSLTTSDPPKFPFSFPAGGVAWPFPSPAQFTKKE